jgi:hypothetical protein
MNNERKVAITITLDIYLVWRMEKDNINRSKFINQLLQKHFRELRT